MKNFPLCCKLIPILIATSALLILSSCERDCGCVQPPFSGTCLESKFEAFRLKQDARAILSYTYEGLEVFLMDAGEAHYDGASPIIDINCDTICHFGGWTTLPCFKEMTFNNIVWEK
jgi:hypothetical protein